MADAIHAGLGWLDDDDALPVPERLGPYRVAREIGRGGLATVYLAERDDEQFTMRVAIKLVRRGMDTDDILRRLRRERQILASLDHPNIAKLLDGGTTDDGRPYFVMEHIEGEHVDAWCRHRGLPVRERLELFRHVCHAVHYAHQNLVLHRDIKPSNVLVTADGVPKLLDFGIAKVLRPHQADADVGGDVSGDGAAFVPTLTRTGMQLLTPEYASPEQVRGEPLTTASDVYSLGIMLYLLVTGRRPYRFDGLRPAQVERVVCDTRPEPPSTVVRRARRAAGRRSSAAHGEAPPPGWRPSGRDDLDNIVLMALRKEPSRRYASAAELADDLRRYLAALPVRARKDTFGYRLARFARRHKVSVAAAALVLVTLMTAVALTSWQARVAQSARERAEAHLATAEAQRARAEHVAGFLVELFELADPKRAQGADITARDMLDEGARKITWALRDDPQLRAALMTTMGRVYLALDGYDEAGDLLAEALAIRRRELGTHDPEVAETLRQLGVLRLEQGAYAEAEELLRRALRRQRRALGHEHPEVAETLHRLAVLRATQGDDRAAEALFRRALDLRRQRLGDDAPEVLETRERLAELAYYRGDYDSAEELFRRVLEHRRRIFGANHPDVAVSLNNLAAVSRAQGELAGAEALLEEALELRRRLLGPRHGDVAQTLHNLAMVELSLGRHRLALERAEQALDINREVYGGAHRAVADNLHILGTVHRILRRYDRAETFFRRAADMRRRVLGDGHPAVDQSLMGLANVLWQRDDVEAAEGLYRQILERQQRLLPADDHRLSYPLFRLGVLLLERGDPVAAEPLLRRAVDIRRATRPAGHWETAQAEGRLGTCLAALGRQDEAEPLLRGSLSALEASLGPEHELTRRAAEHLAAVTDRSPGSPSR